MEIEKLKCMVQSGQYKPEPAHVAEAMLRRRGVRALLMSSAAGHAN